MDYEKKYKEALERAKEILNSYEKRGLKELLFYAKEDLEGIFPELKESEDEIRKELIDAIQGLWDNDALPMPFSVKRKDRWIAWLEKQGTSYTKMDVDDAYVEGMAFAKDELEKQKPTWSEEDEARLQSCLNILQVQAKGFMGITETINTKWLKSIKNRIKGE